MTPFQWTADRINDFLEWLSEKFRHTIEKPIHVTAHWSDHLERLANAIIRNRHAGVDMKCVFVSRAMIAELERTAWDKGFAPVAVDHKDYGIQLLFYGVPVMVDLDLPGYSFRFWPRDARELREYQDAMLEA